MGLFMDTNKAAGVAAGSVRQADTSAPAQPGREADRSGGDGSPFTHARLYFFDEDGVIWHYRSQSHRVPYEGPRPGEYQIFRPIEDVWRWVRP